MKPEFGRCDLLIVALLQKYGPCPIFITFTAAVLSLASSVALVVVDLKFLVGPGLDQKKDQKIPEHGPHKSAV